MFRIDTYGASELTPGLLKEVKKKELERKEREVIFTFLLLLLLFFSSL